MEGFTIKSHCSFREYLSECVFAAYTDTASQKATEVHPLTSSTVAVNAVKMSVGLFMENIKLYSGKDLCSGLGYHLSHTVVLISVTCSIVHMHAEAISATTSSSASKL